MSKTGIGIGVSPAFITAISGGGDCGDADFPLVDNNVDWLIDNNLDCIINGLDPTYAEKALHYRPIAYWPLWEAAGGVAEDISGNDFDGTYTGVALGQTGIGDGNTCPFFDGANDYVNVDSAGLEALFNGDEGSMMLWMKPDSAGQWTDTNIRRPFTFFGNSGVDDQLFFNMDGFGNALIQRRGGGPPDRNDAIAMAGDNWVNLIGIWSRTNNKIELFKNGISSGSPNVCDQDWTSVTLARALIGAWTNVPQLAWLGLLAHCEIFDRALIQSEITDLATV